MAAATLAPVVKTQMARRIIHGGRGVTERAECWGARTTDGVWEFEREDSPGTPWLAYHRPSVADGSYPLPVVMLGSLRRCRAWVAAGYAEKELARRKAEAEQEARARGCDPGCRFPVGKHQPGCAKEAA